MTTHAQEIIDGQLYKLRPMDPMKVLEFGSKITAVVAAPAIEKMTQVGKVDLSGDHKVAITQMISMFSGFVGEALKHTSHVDVRAAFQEVIETATVDMGGSVELELKTAWRTHFLGKPGTLVKFLSWGMKEQFGDFFVAMQDSLLGVVTKRFGSLVSPGSPKEPTSPIV